MQILMCHLTKFLNSENYMDVLTVVFEAAPYVVKAHKQQKMLVVRVWFEGVDVQTNEL